MGTAVPEQPAEPGPLDFEFPRLPGWGPIFLKAEGGKLRAESLKKTRIKFSKTYQMW